MVNFPFLREFLLIGFTVAFLNCAGQVTIIQEIESAYSNGDFEEATTKLKYGLKSDTSIRNHVFYNFRLGDIYCLLSKSDSAMLYINDAIKMDGAVGSHFATRARIFELQKDYNAAIKDLTKAIELEPLSPFHFFHRGLLHKALKEKRNSIQDFEKAKDLAKKNNQVDLYNSINNALKDY